MDNRRESSRNSRFISNPISAQPKTHSLSKTVLGGLIIGGMIGIPIFNVAQSLTRNPNPALFISAMLSIFLLWSGWIKTRQREARIAFINAYRFPAAVKERVGKHYPHLSDDQLSEVMHGLRQYFQLCNDAARETVSMPSRVVDVAWHEFILFTQAYEKFCQYGIGRFLHHTPVEGMVSATTLEEGIKKAWRLACKWENIDQKSPSRLPFLFAIDTALNIPDGFNHSLDNDYATGGSASCGGGGCGGGCGGC